METSHGFVAVQQRNGTVTIPAEVRRAFGLDQPGAQVEVIIRDGEIVLIPHLAVRADTKAPARHRHDDPWSDIPVLRAPTRG